MIELPLIGLDGANPLAFLTALGLLRVVNRISPTSGPRLAWRAEGCWTPVLFLDAPLGPDEKAPPTDQLCEQVAKALRSEVDVNAQTELAAARKTLARARKALRDRRAELEAEARRSDVPRRERRAWIDAQLETERAEAERLSAAEQLLRRRAYPEPHLAVEANLKLTPAELREILSPLVGDPGAIEALGFLAAFATETPGRDGRVIPTRLRFVNGGKHQHFLPALIELRSVTRAEHLHAALFARWTYADEKHTFRWDPAEDRRYALRWSNPSGESSATMWGANVLAFEALPLFPCVPGREPSTTSWRGTRFTWPLWEPAIGVDVVRSLLASPMIASDAPDRVRLRAQGVVEVFTAHRFDDGKGVCNFGGSTPA